MRLTPTIRTAYGVSSAGPPPPCIVLELEAPEVFTLINQMNVAAEELAAGGNHEGAQRLSWRIATLMEAVR